MRRFACAIMVFLAVIMNAASAELSFEPDTPHYFEHFDPEQKPWQPGQALNIEEVFKNYEYYEVRFLRQGAEIQVRRFINNQLNGDAHYRILSDGSLKKILP